MKRKVEQVGATQENGFLKIVKVEMQGIHLMYQTVCVYPVNGVPCGMPRTLRATVWRSGNPKACKGCTQTILRKRSPRAFSTCKLELIPVIVNAALDQFANALRLRAKISRKDLQQYAMDIARNPSCITSTVEPFEVREIQETKVLTYCGGNHAS